MVQLYTPDVLAASSHPVSAGAKDVHGAVACISSEYFQSSLRVLQWKHMLLITRDLLCQ